MPSPSPNPSDPAKLGDGLGVGGEPGGAVGVESSGGQDFREREARTSERSADRVDLVGATPAGHSMAKAPVIGGELRDLARV